MTEPTAFTEHRDEVFKRFCDCPIDAPEFRSVDMLSGAVAESEEP